MAGIIAVYALVISVLIAGNLEPPSKRSYDLFRYAVLQHLLSQMG